MHCFRKLLQPQQAQIHKEQRGGGALNKRVTKAATKKAAAKKSTRRASTQNTRQELSTRGKVKDYGLMPSELDDFNRNLYRADTEVIKGARDTESALRYLPFITIVNTTGFGQQFDLRGQGRLSSTGLKFSINGVNVAPLDSYYGFMPINTVLPSLTQEVQVFPGLNARGGSVNIVTSKRQNPYFLVGAGYTNTTASKGSSYNAYAQAAEKVSPHIKMNAGLGFNQIGGPREDDSQTQGQVVIGAEYDIGWGQTISVDADFYYGKSKTTPYNSFLDAERIMTDIMGDLNNYDACTAGGTCQTINGQQVGAQKWEQIWQAIERLDPYSPDKSDRATNGDGIIESSQTRLVASLDWTMQPTKNLFVDVMGFLSSDKRKYDTHEIYLPYYGFLSISGSDHWTPELAIYNQYGKKYGYNYIEQTGSTFDENKFGGKAKVEVKHGSGLLAFGIDSTYEMGRRKPIQILRGSVSVPPNSGSNIEARIQNELNIDKFTNSFFINENYHLTSKFSVMGGFRYEMINYKVKSNDNIIIENYYKANFNAEKDFSRPSSSDAVYGTGRTNIAAEHKKNYDTFTFELAPAFHYSNSGVIYARLETGYTTPPGYALLVRGVNTNNPNIFKRNNDGSILTDANGKPRINLTANDLFTYETNDLEQETYISYELGFKELIGTRRIPLVITNFDINAILFAANAFYTTSKNEFYFKGDPYSQMTYGTYDKTRRMGLEVALEQYIFGGTLGFNESFTYLKAQRFSEMTEGGEKKWNQIPYTYDYKATFGGNVNIAGMVEIVDVSVNLWLQNSLYGNQRVVATNYLTSGANAGTVEEVEKKLSPYIISDLGLSVGFNKNMGVVTVGVKNLFDTFYYDYYNADRSASINENRYLIGRGRTVFVEGTFRY